MWKRSDNIEVEQNEAPLVYIGREEHLVQLTGYRRINRGRDIRERFVRVRHVVFGIACREVRLRRPRRRRLRRSGRLQQRVRAQRLGDFGHIAAQMLQHRQRRREMVRKLAGNGGARLDLDDVEQTQRQLGVVALLFGRVPEFLYVEIGENAQQSWTHIGPAAQAEIGEAVEAGKARNFHRMLLVRHSGTGNEHKPLPLAAR